MKKTILKLLLLFFIIQYSCQKGDNSISDININDFEIKVIEENRIRTYKYNSELLLVELLDSVEDIITSNNYGAITTYQYYENGLPKEIKYVPGWNGAWYYTIIFQYNETDNSLYYQKEDDISVYIKTFFLNDDNTISYVIGEYMDTISKYNYNEEGYLESIEYSGNGYPHILDTFYYDSNNNLIKVKEISNQDYVSIIEYSYDSKNRWISTGSGGNIIQSYTYYEDGKISSVNGNKVLQKNFFIPKNMKPVNFYIYSYLYSYGYSRGIY